MELAPSVAECGHVLGAVERTLSAVELGHALEAVGRAASADVVGSLVVAKVMATNENQSMILLLSLMKLGLSNHFEIVPIGAAVVPAIAGVVVTAVPRMTKKAAEGIAELN